MLAPRVLTQYSFKVYLEFTQHHVNNQAIKPSNHQILDVKLFYHNTYCYLLRI